MPRRGTKAGLGPALGVGLVITAQLLVGAAQAQALRPPSQTHSESLGDAVASPLRDANLVRSDIPPILERTLTSPYAPPAVDSCVALDREIARLDAALGDDYDAPVHASASEGSDRRVFGAVSSVVSSLVPMRSWIRKLSGAERHEREVREAIRAGSTRRGFLKGLAAGRKCGADQDIVVIHAPAASQTVTPTKVSAIASL